MENEKYTHERILDIRRWTPSLLSFRLSRHTGFRFVPGQFARLGLPDASGSLIWRAYSMASATYDEHLEFFSIVVPNGAFTSLLTRCQVGDTLLVDKTNHGFLTADRFRGGRHLWLLSTGTGLAPFLSILQDADTWQQYERIVLVHSVRQQAELAYRDWLAALPEHPLVGAFADRLIYVPVVTRDAAPCSGMLSERIPVLLANGALADRAGVALTPEDARIMICGNPDMVSDTRKQLKSMGYSVCRRDNPGQLVLENAF